MIDFYEQKYGFKTTDEMIERHKKRIMFFIHNDQLTIAEPNLPFSHAIWLDKLGLISKKNDELMNKIVRGIIDNNNDIYFYTGYDFRTDKQTKKQFFTHLTELSIKISLEPEAKIFAGWPDSIYQGKIKEHTII